MVVACVKLIQKQTAHQFGHQSVGVKVSQALW